MPRWLSEGISVYEERQRDVSWGESMTPAYREMLLSEDLTPVSQLSAAFLSPPSPVHLQFAYFESSLVIEFLIQEHGLEKLKAILVDLGNGISMNDALARHTGSLNKLDATFDAYAKQVASKFGERADWSKEDLPEKPTLEDLQKWVVKNPNNFWARQSLATMLVRRKKFQEAKEHLEHLVSLGAVTGSSGGVLEMLAPIYRNLNQQEDEVETLKKTVSLCSNALPALRRLTELSTTAGDWESVRQYSQKILAINPMLFYGQESAARAAEELDEPNNALPALMAQLQLDPIDPAELNYRVARAHHGLGQRDDARRFVLAALDEAPRYRDAHRLLLQLSEDYGTASAVSEKDSEPVDREALAK
jgi:tetratricopeptide (TPR) repeat protein